MNYGPHTHDFFEVLLIEAPGGVHRVNGVAEHVRRGPAWFLRPGVSHDLAELGQARGWPLIAGAEALGAADPGLRPADQHLPPCR